MSSSEEEGLRAKVLQRFAENRVLQDHEILQQVLHSGPVEDGRESKLQEILSKLVVEGELGKRALVAGGNEHTVYWTKRKRGVDTDTHSTSSVKKGTLFTSEGKREKEPAATSMSASLRERLQRSRPRFVSPLLSSAKKKPRLDKTEKERATFITKLDFSDGGIESTNKGNSEEATSVDKGEAEREGGGGGGRGGGGKGGGGEQVQLLLAERKSLESQLSEREEELRKLKMVQMYHTKNDLKQLDSLISKWREVSQEAAQALLSTSPLQPPPSMAQLLDYLHIEHSLIHYSSEDEAFC